MIIGILIGIPTITGGGISTPPVGGGTAGEPIGLLLVLTKAS